jgi:preprotein translocase subunit SecE
MNSLFLYLKDSYNELMNNVTWPTWSELFSSANVVIAASIIIAIIVAIMDAISNTFTDAVYNINF